MVRLPLASSALCCASLLSASCASVEATDPLEPGSIAIEPLAALTVLRNTVTPATVSLTLYAPELVGASVVQVRSSEPALIPSASVPCPAMPCTLSFTPSPERTATVEVALTVQADERDGKVLVDVHLAPLWVRDATDAEPPAPASLRAVLAGAETGSVIGFDPASGFDTPQIIELSAPLAIERTTTLEGPGPDLLSISGDGSFGLMTVAGAHDATLVGMSLTDGFAGKSGGGAVAAPAGSHVTARDVRFVDNTATSGGAILAEGGSLTLHDCVLANNAAEETGGAVTLINTASATITGSTFDTNAAPAGGALFGLEPGPVIVEDSEFTFNDAESGGGMFLSAATATHQLSGATFIGNTADNYAALVSFSETGAIEIVDSDFSRHVTASVAVVYVTNADLRNVRIHDNQTAAAALYLTGQHALLSGVEVSDNTAVAGGAGVLNAAARAEIVGSTIRDNTVSHEDGVGGGLYALSSVSLAQTEVSRNHAHEGGGIYVAADAEVDLHGSQVISNTAESGAGLYVTEGGLLTLAGGTTVLDNVAESAGGGLLVHVAGEARVDDASIGELDHGNVAANGGGVFSIGDVALTAATLIEGNQANFGGGILHALPAGAIPTLQLGSATLRANHADSLGGGLWWVPGSVLLAHEGLTIAENTVGTAQGGGGLYINGNVGGQFPCEFPVDRVFDNTDPTGANDIAPDPGLCGG